VSSIVHLHSLCSNISDSVIIHTFRAEKTGGGGSEAITGLATQDFASSMVTADGNAFDAKEYQYKKEVSNIILVSLYYTSI